MLHEIIGFQTVYVILLNSERTKNSPCKWHYNVRWIRFRPKGTQQLSPYLKATFLEDLSPVWFKPRMSHLWRDLSLTSWACCWYDRPRKTSNLKTWLPPLSKKHCGFSYIKYSVIPVIYVIKLFLRAKSKNLEFHQCQRALLKVLVWLPWVLLVIDDNIW